MKIRTKILLPLVIMLIVFIGMFTFLILYLNSLKNEFESNILTIQKINDLSIRIGFESQQIRQETLSYQITKDEYYVTSISRKRDEISALIEELKPLIVTDSGLQIMGKFEEKRDAVIGEQIKLTAVMNGNDSSKVNKQFNLWQQKADENDAVLMELMDYNLHSLERNHIIYEELISATLIAGVIVALLTAVSLGIFYLYLRKIITIPIQKLSYVAQSISNSNFNTNIYEINSNDELGVLSHNLKVMSVKIKKYYKTLKDLAYKKEKELQKAKELEAQKDNFFNIASHELKTPITSLKIYGQLLQKESENNGHLQYLNYLLKMDKQIVKLTGLISSLLDVTRIQGGKMVYDTSIFDLNKCIKDKVEIYRETSGDYKIIMLGKIKQKISGDENRIGQVIDNLLANAIKYSPDNKKVIVKIRDLKNSVQVSVKDFGIGIDKSHQNKIFSRFYRINDNDQKIFPGLGIGLYVSWEIIRQHNGKLWVESEKGKGSTFNFTLPY